MRSRFSSWRAHEPASQSHERDFRLQASGTRDASRKAQRIPERKQITEQRQHRHAENSRPDAVLYEQRRGDVEPQRNQRERQPVAGAFDAGFGALNLRQMNAKGRMEAAAAGLGQP